MPPLTPESRYTGAREMRECFLSSLSGLSAQRASSSFGEYFGHAMALGGGACETSNHAVVVGARRLRRGADALYSPSGWVKDVSVAEADFDDVPLEDCIMDVMETVEFEPPDGGVVLVSYPFFFELPDP